MFINFVTKEIIVEFGTMEFPSDDDMMRNNVVVVVDDDSSSSSFCAQCGKNQMVVWFHMYVSLLNFLFALNKWVPFEQLC